MPSPFPGMDPYLEDRKVWPEFHAIFIVKLRKAIEDALPPGYSAHIGRHVYVVEPGEERLLIGVPDATVARGDKSGPGGAGTLVAPVTVQLPAVRRESNRYVEILDDSRQEVVTVVELLSPSNKRSGPDRDAYLAKRAEYLARRLNLVEIDLLRSGQRMPVEVPPQSDYFILVSSEVEYPSAGGWPLGVRDPLPRIPVPLGPDVPFPWLDLAAVANATYDEGPFRRSIDYSKPPTPRLHDPDATWARDLLARRPGAGG